MNEYQRISEQIQALKELSMKSGLPILFMAQVKSRNEKDCK